MIDIKIYFFLNFDEFSSTSGIGFIDSVLPICLPTGSEDFGNYGEVGKILNSNHVFYTK